MAVLEKVKYAHGSHSRPMPYVPHLFEKGNIVGLGVQVRSGYRGENA